MSAATCPNCLEPVTVPPGAKADALVRCPLCQEEFELSLVLDAMPPRLIVVGGAGSAEEGSSGGMAASFLSGSAATVDESADEFRLADEEDHPPAFQFAQPAEGAAAPGAATITARPKKKGKNGAVEMVKIVGGGVLGLSIGYVLIWWISPLVGKRPTDPIGLAPTVSRFVPWIVPEALRGPASPKDTQGGSGFDSAAAEARMTTDSPPKSARPAGVVRSPRPNQLAPADRQPPQSLGAPAFDSLPPQATPNVSVPGVEAPDIGAPIIEPPAIEPDLGTLGPEIKESLVADAPAISLAMLQQRADDARSSYADWQQAGEKDKARVAVNCYVALGALGEATTFVDRGLPKSQPHLNSAQKLIAELAADPARAEVFGKLGVKWIKSSSRTHRGVFLTGTVDSIEDHGGLHEIRLNLTGAAEPMVVSVFSSEAPAPEVQAGGRLVVLGAIVTDPALNLTGYTGDESLVVVSGSQAFLP